VAGLVRDRLAQQGAGHPLDAAGAAAQAAGLDRAPFLRARARAGVAHDRGGRVELDGAAEGRGLQVDADADEGVLAALGAWDRAAGLTASAAEEGLEDVAESAESATGREALPVLSAAHIVVAALLRVGEDIVGQ